MAEWTNVGAYMTYRLEVPGGWLYRRDHSDTVMCFVPEPQGDKVPSRYAASIAKLIMVRRAMRADDKTGDIESYHKNYDLMWEAIDEIEQL